MSYKFQYRLLAALILLTSCSTDKHTEKIDPKILESISPGSAIGKFKILNLSNEKTEIKINVELHEVLGYGSSTEPLNDGTKFNFVLLNGNYDNKKIQINSVLIMEITKQEEQMMKEGKTSENSLWRIVRIY